MEPESPGTKRWWSLAVSTILSMHYDLWSRCIEHHRESFSPRRQFIYSPVHLLWPFVLINNIQFLVFPEKLRNEQCIRQIISVSWGRMYEKEHSCNYTEIKIEISIFFSMENKPTPACVSYRLSMAFTKRVFTFWQFIFSKVCMFEYIL